MKRALLIYSALLGASALLAAPTAKPNILFLLSDDQAWNGLSCRMHPDLPDSASAVIETPNIARLAGEGMRFSQAYSPASVCSPTRISLQTGKSPAQCQWTKAAPPEVGFKLVEPRIRKNIEAEETTVGELLQSAGYATAHYGKWHIGGGGPASHGYDESDGETGNEDAAPHVEPNPVDIFGMNERAVAFMEKSKQAGKPFFIQMSYNALHYPENATRALIEKYSALLPGGNEKEIGAAAISEDLDRGVGELLNKLEELMLTENTYVLYMSDNGGSTRKTLSGGKGGVWEGGIRVPLIVRGPGVVPDSWCHERVVGYDFFPTFCEWAGVTQALPKEIEGGSITSLLQGGGTPVKRPREELVFHFPHYQGDTPHTALLLGDYKLLRFYEDHSLQLYDLRKDLREANDRAGSMPEKVSELEKRMDRYLTEVHAQLPTLNPDYDPENPPSLGDRKGNRGNMDGKGKMGRRGGKKGMEAEPRKTEEAPATPAVPSAAAPTVQRSAPLPAIQPSTRAPRQGAPNFVIILIDDMGWNAMGFTGNTVIETPRTDEMARQGMIFTNAYASAPNCAPTRASLMSGQYTPRHGVYTVVDERHNPGMPSHKILSTGSKSDLATESVTIAESLKAGGYATAMFGMWNLGRGQQGPTTPTGQGFDVFKDPKSAGFDKDCYFNEAGEYLSDAFTTEGIKWMTGNRGKPFFIYMAYHDVHAPFEAKPELVDKYRKKGADDPDYAATVEALDTNIGRIVDALKANGLDDNTVVIFHSDNGGTREYIAPLAGGKGTLYEGGLRVPTAIRGPGIVTGETPVPILSMDLYPTILELAGLQPPQGHLLDGISLVPLLTGKTRALERKNLFWHFPCYIGGGGPGSAMRQDDWKVIEFFESKTYEVYNLRNDPGETQNLFTSDPEKSRQLIADLHAWQGETGAPRPGEPNPKYDPDLEPERGRGRREKGG
ncbi:MAG: sulfatase [Verrucomicrobiales bacterium]